MNNDRLVQQMQISSLTQPEETARTQNEQATDRQLVESFCEDSPSQGREGGGKDLIITRNIGRVGSIDAPSVNTPASQPKTPVTSQLTGQKSELLGDNDQDGTLRGEDISFKLETHKIPITTTKDTGADNEQITTKEDGEDKKEETSNQSPLTQLSPQRLAVTSQLNRFQGLLLKDIDTFQQGGITRFQRVNFLRKIEQGLKPQNENENQSTIYQLRQRFEEKTKKISYPISWIDYYKNVGKSKLITQVTCGYLIQLIVLALQVSIYTTEDEDIQCRDGFGWSWDFIVMILVHFLFIPYIMMMVWFFKNKTMAGILDLFQWLKNFFRIPMGIITIYDLYLDMLAIRICSRYETITRREGQTELADKFSNVRIASILMLQFSMIPRYFFLIWTWTGFGSIFPKPCKRFVQKKILYNESEFDTDKDSDLPVEKQIASLFFICEDNMSGQVLKYLKSEEQDLAYNTWEFEKTQTMKALGIKILMEELPHALLQMVVIAFSHDIKACQGDQTVDNSYLQASICIAFFTAILSCLMNISDYIYREKNFLAILSDVYLESDKEHLKQENSILDAKSVMLAVSSQTLKFWTLDNIKFSGTNKEWEEVYQAYVKEFPKQKNQIEIITMGHISGLTYKKAKLFLKFIGDGKKFILDNRNPQIMRVIVKHNNTKVNVEIDGIEQIWPNHDEHKIIQQQFRDNVEYPIKVRCLNQERSVVKIPQFDEESVEDDDKLVEQIQVHTNLKLSNQNESSLQQKAEDQPLKVILTRIHPKTNMIHMRQAENMNYYIYWNYKEETDRGWVNLHGEELENSSKGSKANEVCIGELGCLIPYENKVWTLNEDKTISPYDRTDIVIGVADRSEGMVLTLLKQDIQKDTMQQGTSVIYFENFKLPEFVKFRREFSLSNRRVILEQPQSLKRMNFLESMKHAQQNNGRLLRLVEIEQLLLQEGVALCPDGEMWIAAAYDKWIQVGPYCSTFSHKTGSKINKKIEKDYNIYRREPYGNLGQLYIIESKKQQQTLKDVLEFFK